MLALKERSDKDMAQQDVEMKELHRIIKHDNKLKEFMGIKVNDRLELKEEEMIKRSKGKGRAYIRKTYPCNIYPLIPHCLVYRKTGVYRDIPIFLIFAPKHILWVLYVLSKIKKNIKKFILKIFIFYNFKNLCILHGHVFVMDS